MRRSTPKRKASQKEPRRIIRVLCEGDVTEPEYLQILAGSNVSLDVRDSGMTPKPLVDRARDYVRNRRGREGDQDFDEIWCVFDRDAHEDIPGTMQKARDLGIGVAFSNPCFELWLVLHLEDQRAHIERRSIQTRCRELGLTVGKHINPDAHGRLRCTYHVAKTRAQHLDEMHHGNDSPPLSNPSSSVWRLIDCLRQS